MNSIDKWMHFGKFHLTSLGLGWVLCLFSSLETVENVLAGGPWNVKGHIVGIDKWSSQFSPNFVEGLTSPIWVGMPHLPLLCWDEVNVVRISSMLGTPLWIDGNMLQWGRREMAWVCVHMALDKQFPMGLWVEGSESRFFQKVEYEKISTFCFKCEKIGHFINECNLKENVPGVQGASNSFMEDNGVDIALPDVVSKGTSYGPWENVNNGRRRKFKPIVNELNQLKFGSFEKSN